MKRFKKTIKISICLFMIVAVMWAQSYQSVEATDAETTTAQNDTVATQDNAVTSEEPIIQKKNHTTLKQSRAVDSSGVYVSNSGNDATGDGTFDYPFKTVDKAYKTVTTGHAIYILNTVTISSQTNFNLNKDVTLTSASAADGTPITNGSQAKALQVGAVIDAIRITNGSLTTKNITFTSSVSNIGRVIYASNAAAVVNLNEGTTFSNLASTNYRGTAIYSVGKVNINGNENNPVTVENVTSGKDYGVISIYGAYASCVMNSTGDKGIIFDSCSTTSGGVIRMNSTSTLEINGDPASKSSVYFNKCSSNAQGGAISAAETTTVTMSNVTFNACSSTSGNGGAIGYSGTQMLTIKDCVFTGNTSGNRGGAVSSGIATIDNCTFDHNTAQNGGAISLSACKLTNSTFTNNTARNSGGAAYFILNGGKTADVSDCTFEKNDAVKSGGGINSAYDAANDPGTFNLTDCKVINNTCTDTSGRGGGVYTSTNSNIEGCQVTSNSCNGNGGGIYVYQGFYHRETDIIITDSDTKSSVISNNNAVSGGGIFEMFISNINNDCSLNIEGKTSITNNTSTSNGGGIATQSSVTNNTITFNIKDDVRIMGNSSRSGNGGGIYQNSNTTVNMSGNAVVSGNSCGSGELGGGIYNANTLANKGKFTIKDNVQIVNNITDHNQAVKNNYAILNGDALSMGNESTHYGIYVVGALGGNAAIHVYPVHSEKGVLIATALNGSTYVISDSDQKRFYNDQMSNGIIGAYPIYFDTTNITGNNNNLILFGTTYDVEHYYGIASKIDRISSDTPDITTEHVGNALTKAEYSVKNKYGYTLSQITYQNNSGSSETPTTSNITVPSADGLVIRLYYKKNTYDVKFQSSDQDYIKVEHGSLQKVNYEENAASGATYKMVHVGQEFFTGWLYEMDVDGKKVTGVTMDYTTIPIRGNTTFTATYASVPFLSINSPVGGSVSMQKGNTEKYIENNTHFDNYQFEKNDKGPYIGTGAFRAEPHYHVASITVIFPNADGTSESFNLNINNSSVQNMGTGGANGTAKLTINADKTYGTINITAKSSAMIIVQYEEDPTYRVTYIANYSSTDTTEVQVKEGLYTGDTVGAAPTDSLYLPGYRLVGWSTTRINGANSSYVNSYDESTRIKNSNITYYAIWESIGQYEYDMIVYLEDENGNFIESSKYSTIRSVANPDSWIYFNYDDSGTIKNERNIIGYTYDKANTSNISSFYFDSTDPDLDFQHVSLKSYFKLNRYDVTYVLNNGDSDIVQSQKAFHSKVTPPSNPVRAGYTFMGFYEDKDFVYKADFNTYTVPEYNTTFYAKWKIKNYTVKYDTYGGNSIEDKTNVLFHDANLLPAPPKKEGYTFMGWTVGTKEVKGTTKYSDLVANDNVKEVTLVARWKENTYTVKYDTDGGNSINNKTGVLFHDIDLLPADPKKEGYTFVGWYVDTKEVKKTTKYSDLVADNSVQEVTLKARWEKNGPGHIDGNDKKYNVKNGTVTAIELLKLLNVKATDSSGDPYDLSDLIVDQKQLDTLNKAIKDKKTGVYIITVIAPDGTTKVLKVTLITDDTNTNTVHDDDDTVHDNDDTDTVTVTVFKDGDNGKTNEKTVPVDTGDDVHVISYLSLACLSLIIIISILRKRTHR